MRMSRGAARQQQESMQEQVSGQAFVSLWAKLWDWSSLRPGPGNGSPFRAGRDQQEQRIEERG